jgi:hypothetical protein
MYFKYIWAKKYFKTDLLTIERLNSNKDYSFENCIFISKSNQQQNTSKLKWFIAKNIMTGEEIRENNISNFVKQHSKFHISNIAWALKNPILKSKNHRTVNGWIFDYV